MKVSGAKTTAAATTGPGHRADAGFVDAGDGVDAEFPQPSFVAQVGPLAHRDLCHPFQARLANRFGRIVGIGDFMETDRVVGAGRRRDRDVAESEHPLKDALVDFDRADVRQFHLAPARRDQPALFDQPIGSETPVDGSRANHRDDESQHAEADQREAGLDRLGI